MNIELYVEALANFDWFGDYSDDYRVWYKWSADKKFLQSMRNMYDEDFVLWNQYAPDKFKIIKNKA